jgi:hypothetical protein
MERLAEKPDCSICKTLKGDSFDWADCIICIPNQMEENVDAEKIYAIVQDQVLLGFGGPVALNQIAIHMAMDLYGIKDRVGCFEKVLAVGRHFIKKYNQSKDEKNGDVNRKHSC